ncbi:hypothetical protein DFJ73DRAFT_564977 [Zopfochytrium polystomum]|nr:hypothetical protein DFJ73DRAFT_564977 [Zopfochytrium polystomum]
MQPPMARTPLASPYPNAAPKPSSFQQTPQHQGSSSTRPAPAQQNRMDPGITREDSSKHGPSVLNGKAPYPPPKNSAPASTPVTRSLNQEAPAQTLISPGRSSPYYRNQNTSGATNSAASTNFSNNNNNPNADGNRPNGSIHPGTSLNVAIKQEPIAPAAATPTPAMPLPTTSNYHPRPRPPPSSSSSIQQLQQFRNTQQKQPTLAAQAATAAAASAAGP